MGSSEMNAWIRTGSRIFLMQERLSATGSMIIIMKDHTVHLVTWPRQSMLKGSTNSVGLQFVVDEKRGQVKTTSKKNEFIAL